jgi:hypothetical protein
MVIRHPNAAINRLKVIIPGTSNGARKWRLSAESALFVNRARIHFAIVIIRAY